MLIWPAVVFSLSLYLPILQFYLRINLQSPKKKKKDSYLTINCSKTEKVMSIKALLLHGINAVSENAIKSVLPWKRPTTIRRLCGFKHGCLVALQHWAPAFRYDKNQHLHGVCMSFRVCVSFLQALQRLQHSKNIMMLAPICRWTDMDDDNLCTALQNTLVLYKKLEIEPPKLSFLISAPLPSFIMI